MSHRFGMYGLPGLRRLPKKEHLQLDFLESVFHDIKPGINSQMARKIKEKLGTRDSFTFATLGDSGKQNGIFEKVLKEAATKHPDFIMITGDAVRSGTVGNYRRLIDTIKEIDIPLLLVPGNHDLKGDGYTLFSYLFGSTNFFFDIGINRFIVLNSNEQVNFKARNPFVHLPSNNGSHIVQKGLAAEQIEHLAALLVPQKRHFLFLHVPPKGPWNHHCFKLNAEEFTGLVSRNARLISRVFCGHIHGYCRKDYKGVTYMITAGAGGNFHQHDPEIIERYNFVLHEIHPNKVKDIVYFCDQ